MQNTLNELTQYAHCLCIVRIVRILRKWIFKMWEQKIKTELNNAKYGNYIHFKREVSVCINFDVELKGHKIKGVEMFSQPSWTLFAKKLRFSTFMLLQYSSNRASLAYIRHPFFPHHIFHLLADKGKYCSYLPKSGAT